MVDRIAQHSATSSARGYSLAHMASCASSCCTPAEQARCHDSAKPPKTDVIDFSRIFGSLAGITWLGPAALDQGR